MATHSWTSAPSNASAAALAAWGSSLSAALAAVGMVKTSDTGQINWASPPAPVSNAMVGYEMWRFDDALQATSPIFLKVGYGSPIQTAVPAISVSVGRGSDGALGLTGHLATLSPMRSAASVAVSNSFNNYVTSDGSDVAVLTWANSTDAAPMFAVERSRDAAGNPTGEAVLLAGAGGAPVAPVTENYVLKHSGSPNDGSTRYDTLIHMPMQINSTAVTPASTVSPDGTSAPVWPVPVAGANVGPWISGLLLGIMPGDIGGTGIFSASINGKSRTYRGFVPAARGAGPGLFAETAGYRYIPAVRWE